jgi:hypothetical protein
MFDRVPQKRGLGKSRHFSILSSSKKRGRLQVESNLKSGTAPLPPCYLYLPTTAPIAFFMYSFFFLILLKGCLMLTQKFGSQPGAKPVKWA